MRREQKYSQLRNDRATSATLTQLQNGHEALDADADDEQTALDPSAPQDDDVTRRTERRKNMMGEQERKEKLLSDEWTSNVMPQSVDCGACGKTISLDKRSRYYPGLWLKHRGKCQELKRLEEVRRLELKFPHAKDT